MVKKNIKYITGFLKYLPLPRKNGKHHILPTSHYFLLALLFFVGLELIVAFHRWIILLVITLLLLMFYGVFLVKTEERGRFKLVQVILPTLAATGLASFSLFLPRSPLIHLYFLLASALFFWLLKHGAKQAYPTWNWTIATVVFFIDVAVVMGLRFHLYVPVLLTLFLIFIIGSLIGIQALSRLSSNLSNVLLLSISLAFVLTQLAWVLMFLPLHFLTQAGILVVFYYVFFHVIGTTFERKINRSDIIEYTILGLVALLMLIFAQRI